MADDVPPPTAAECLIRDVALRYPEAWVDHPWDHIAVKVRKKVFLFLSSGGERVSGSVKLPVSALDALELPFTTPTSYGMAKYGWVSFSLAADEELPIELLEDWIDESYRAIAPKRVVRALPEFGPPTST